MRSRLSWFSGPRRVRTPRLLARAPWPFMHMIHLVALVRFVIVALRQTIRSVFTPPTRTLNPTICRTLIGWIFGPIKSQPINQVLKPLRNISRSWTATRPSQWRGRRNRNCLQPARISELNRVPTHISIRIRLPTRPPDRVFTDEPSGRRTVIPVPVVNKRPDANPPSRGPLSLIRQGFPAYRLHHSENFFQTRFWIDSYLETSATSGSLRSNRRMASVTA
jgi:hypothetical protein